MSTSELFGERDSTKSFNEKSRFNPKSPFMVFQKLYSFTMTNFIEKPIICLHVMEFYLTTKVQDEVKLLSQKNYNVFC